MSRWLWLLIFCCASFLTEAANFEFNPPALPAASLCNTSWDYNAGSSTYTCTGNGRVTVTSGNSLSTTGNITIVAANGFSIANSVVGSSANRINLTSTYGTFSATSSSTIWGNVQTSSGAFTLTGTTINGTLTTNSSLTTTGGAINGGVDVQNGITSNGTTFNSSITSNGGSINLTGGAVTGIITTTCCALTTTNTNLAGGAIVKSGITITGGTISGDYTMTSNNPAVVDSVTMTSGSITSASTVTITNSTLGSDTSPILVTAVSGSVTVNNSEVFGDITTPSYGTVYVNGTSEVVGSCVPIDEPLFACGGVATVTRESYWRFDEALWNGTNNEVKDSSLEAKDGTARNSAVVSQLNPSPASCTYGDFQAVGASGHPFAEINRGSYFHDSDEFGYTLWLKMDASAQASGSQTLMAYGGPVSATSGRFQLTRESGGNLRFTIRMTGGTTRFVEVSGTNIFNDQWQHIAFSYSKNNRRMRLYVNNVLVDDTPNSSIDNGDAAKTPNDGTGNFAIGALPNGTAGIRGQIDEVRFFNRELRTADIKNMYEQAASCATTSLVLGWDLNQGLWTGAANEVIDFSGNNLHGQTFNSVQSFFDDTALTGDPGTCSFSQFNGSNQYIETADNALLDMTSAFTLSLWVKPSGRPVSGLMTMVSKDNNYEIHQQPDGKVQWWWNDATPTARQLVSSTALVLNQWNHIVLVYASGSQQIFINGAQDATASFTGTLTTNNSPLQLGQDQGAAGRYFHGFLDELRIYNGALPTPQILALHTERRVCSQCFTENFNTTENWYASAYGGSETPSAQSNPQRLRLTRNIAEQSTSMTIRKKFPGVGNKVSVEFNYYAWKPTSGGGADGIAVTLSDANYTPAPGSFGGSLGYAQRTSPSNDPGFNGGWIGIGLDEFGNFSNPSEGRQGGPGFRPQAVALRGSLPNYNYLTGTNVSPNLDVVGTNTPGPGHRYRITVDATTTTPTQQALVKVERDTTGTGNSYSTIINNYNAAAASGQQTVPEDFFLSFTGATGASVNNHEIATIQVCTVQPAPEVVITPPSAVHHYELNYVSNGVTCEAEKIEVKACANQSCSTLSTAAVSTTISATNGGSFVGGALLNFVGSTEVYLSQTNIGETTLAVAGGSNANVCSTTGCKINFANAGFKFYNATSGTAGLQNQVAGVPGSGFLRAVQTNTDTMACEARVAGPKNVSMSFDCVNPGNCSEELEEVLVLKDNSPGSNTETVFDSDDEGVNKTVSLIFDGQGYAPLGMNYSDVGQLTLSASLALAASGNSPAVTLNGQSDPFVVRPHRINVTTALSAATADPANAVNPQTLGTGTGFVAAGEDFQLYVSPVNAQGNLTPNYGNETVPENVAVQFGQLLYPAAGVAGTLTASAAFEKVSTGPYVNRFHSDEVSWNEVGTFTLTASVADNDYLGTSLGAASSSTAYTVGRFYPAQFKLDSSSLSDGCNGFSYMGKAGINLNYQLSARNVADQVTTNYSSNYASTATAAVVLENADDGIDLSDRMSSAAGTWQAGLMTVTQNNLTFGRAADLAVVDGPFQSLTAGIRLTDTLDGRDFATGSKNMDPDVAGSCGINCDAVALSNTLNLRYGRLKLIGGSVADAPTTGSVRLPVQLQAEYWNGSRFVLNVADSFTAPSTPSCTQVNFNQVNVTSGSDEPAVLGELGHSLTQGASTLTPDSAVYFDITPSTPVSVWPIEYENTPAWLKFNWLQETGSAVLENPSSEISVGRYRGNKRQIFWQEKLN